MYQGRTHLDFIQLIPSNNQLHPSVPLTEHLDPVGNLRVTPNLNQHLSKCSSSSNGRVPLFRQGNDVNTHRDGSDIHKTLLGLDALRERLEGQNPADRLPV